jgi:hypothetical protein
MAARALSFLVLLGTVGQLARADVCPDDPEIDLCEDDTVEGPSHGHSISPNLKVLIGVLAMALPKGQAKHAALAFALVPLATLLPGATAVTCGELKTFYKGEQCCGSPTKEVSGTVPGAPACPYNFNKPVAGRYSRMRLKFAGV